MTPLLNWKEIAAFAESVNPAVQGLFTDRVFIPHRPHFPAGFLKGEWALAFSGKKNISIVFNLRATRPYIYVSVKKLKAAPGATHSAFDLALGKTVKGAKVQAFGALPRERVLALWFGSPKEAQYGLILSMIPARPEALLVQRDSGEDSGPWPILASSRVRNGDTHEQTYSPPDGKKAPENLNITPKWFSSAEALESETEKALEEEAFALRLRNCEKTLRELLKVASTRLRQSKTALDEAGREADWQGYGDLLKAALPESPKLKDGVREATDFSTGEKIRIPCDPKLSATEQVEKFYSLAKRRSRRIREAQTRIKDFQEETEDLEKSLARVPGPGDWKTLEALEKSCGLSPSGAVSAGKGGKPETHNGKMFVSKDGYRIFVGRSKDENLALTFKQARGNDLWLHIRGKPGAHVIVPLPSGKSAPLETLLDAATLAVYYSGGEKWGKTEVDYTFKKHVRRIKDSSEASYTHNKTLMIEVDPGRLKKLMGERK